MKQTKPVSLLIKQPSQSSIHLPSYIHLHQFIPGSINYTHQISYDEGYTVTLRTSNINDRIIQASIIESTLFRREEAYIVKYVDPIEQPVIDYDSNPCKSFSFPYCILQNYDDSDHYSFSYSIFYQSGYVIYIDINELDIPLTYLNSTLIDSVLLSLHNNETDVFTCTTYSDRLLNGCLIARQSLIREIITKTTISKGKLDVLDYIPLYFKEMNRELKVESMMIRESLSPYLNMKDKLIPSVFGCDLSENDTSFTVSVTTYRRPKMNMVFDGFDKQELQPKQVIMIQNTDILNWNTSLFANRKTQYYHIWCSNWNSKYVGKYHPGIMFDTTFNFVIDDDFFIDDSHGFASILDVVPFDSAIYGQLCTTLMSNTFKIREDSMTFCDHAHNMLYTRVKHFKIMFQGDLLTYGFGEDAQLGIIDYVNCNILSKRLVIKTIMSHTDQYRAGGKGLGQPKKKYPFRNKKIYIREKEDKWIWITNIYRFFVTKGYVLLADREQQ